MILVHRQLLTLTLTCWVVLLAMLVPDCCLAAPGQRQAEDLQLVRLRLKWEHQFQFAGCYAAQEQGYFREAGLRVKLLPGRVGQSSTEALLAQEADYGIGGPEILQLRLQGEPLVALAVIMQQSPSALVAVQGSGIATIEDLRNRKLLLLSRSRSVEIYAMLEHAGLHPADYFTDPLAAYNVDSILSGEYAALHGYTTNEPFLIQQAGRQALVFRPADYGVDFYGDTLFTTEREVMLHPQRAEAVRNAVLRGWQYALDHPEEIIRLIQTRYDPDKSTEQLRFEAQAMRELIAHPLIDIGQMSSSRWGSMADTMLEVGVVQDKARLAGLSYDTYPAFERRPGIWLRDLLSIAILSMILIGLLVLYNLHLRRAVRFRTAELTALNTQLNTQLSEHQRVVRELQESRRDYTEAQRIAMVGNWSYDCSTGVLEWSDEVYRIYGIDPQEPPSMADALERTHEDDRSLLRSCLRDAIRDGLYGSVVRRIIRDDNEIGYVNTVFEPVVNEQGRTVLLRGTVQDVTEIRVAEEARDESERAYDALFGNSIELIFMFSVDGRLLDANAQILELCGAQRSALIGTAQLQPQHAEFIGKLWRTFGLQGLQGALERSIRELPVLDSNGQERWIEGYGVPLRNEDGIYAVLGVTRDVTQRRLVEQRAMEVERKYQSLFDNSVEMIFVVDSEGRFLEANDNALQSLGYQRSDLPGLTLRDVMDDPIYRKAMRAVHGVMAGERRGELQEFRAITSTGRQLWFESAGVRLERHGRPWAVLSVARDITGRKQAEEERRNLEAQLRQTQKLEAIGTLAGGIAHDFNNLLFAIRGNADLALTLPGDEENTRECLMEILSASGRATELVQQILSFARKSEVEMRVIDLNTIFAEVLRLIRATIPANIEIVSDLGNGPNWVYGDTTQMHQLMMNLCSNAGYAMRDSGGRLSLRLRNIGKIQESGSHRLEGDGGQIKLIVEDTGVGMNAAVRDRIFEPFYTTKEMGEGTGMGLSAVHGIVSAMHGSIEVESEVGIGTKFTIMLPQAQASMIQQPEQRADIPRGTEHVLVVDDEESIVRVMRSSLSNLGYFVTACTESRSALETFMKSPELFDLVITDQAMPGLTGNQLAREISSVRRNLPIIICSGNNVGNNPAEARHNGVSMFLHKPVERRELALAIRSLLD